MTDAETRTAIATSGETRSRAELDEIVLGDVSIPVRSIQRTDTSRFEGKVTFGDYTVDSDQLMSTWAQNSWIGGMMIDEHTEGATDQRFRWARAWTQSHRAMTLPLAVATASPAHTPPPAYATTKFFPWGFTPTSVTRSQVVPVGAWESYALVVNGRKLSRVHVGNSTVTAAGDLADEAYERGAWHIDPGGATSPALWIPMGQAGIQAYNPDTGTIHPVDTTVSPVAAVAWDNRLYVLERRLWGSSQLGGGFLNYMDLTGTWTATSPTRTLPYEENPLGMELFWDRNGSKVVVILTDKQVWYYQPDADQLVPLGLEVPKGLINPHGLAAWRDDGLYVRMTNGTRRLSSAGVITDMGLDRDDGYLDPETVDFGVTPGAELYIPTLNALMATVTRTVVGGTGGADVLAWNEAGWHHLARIDPGTLDFFKLTTGLVMGYNDFEYLVVGSAVNTGDPDGLYIVRLPYGVHAPRKTPWLTRYASTGEYYSGWFDAGMRNFYKAWSQVEIYLTDPLDGTTTPPGTVDVYYRTESDTDTWVHLGATDTYGRNVFQMPTAVSDVGVTSLKIELKLELTDTTGASPLFKTPIIEATVLKFIKLAQHGSAWQAYVALSDYTLWRGLGPTQIDDYLSRLTSEGSTDGPFVTMIHKRNKDGEPSTHRVRVAQWQRSEMPGDVPYGDGVLNIIAVPVAEIPGA